MISNDRDSSITSRMDKQSAGRLDCKPLVLDDDKDIEAEFNEVYEYNKIIYNHPYSIDQFEVASSTSSNSKTYSTTEVQKEDTKSGDKQKQLPRTVITIMTIIRIHPKQQKRL